jgi:hypothetical protein
MRIRHLATSVTTAGLTMLLLAACGGNSGTTSDAAGSSSAASSSSAPATPAGNGEAAKTGPQVASDAADALAQAGAVHMVGTGTSDGQPMSLDLHLQGADVSGTITMAGQAMDILTTGGQAYAKAPATFWSAQQVPASIAKKLGGQWVVLPHEAASSFGDFSLAKLADQLRKPEKTTWQPQVQKSTWQGQDVVVLTESDGSTTPIAATGAPYPLHADDKGADAGTVTLSDFGVKVPIVAPASPVDLQKLAG